MAEKPFGRKVNRLLHFFERASSHSSGGSSASPEDYCHDIASIKQSTLILDHNAKTLEKLQDEIVRRMKRDKNGLIGVYRGKYDGCLTRMRHELRNLLNNLFNDDDELVATNQSLDHVVAVPPKADRDGMTPSTGAQVPTSQRTMRTDESWREEVRRLQAIVQRYANRRQLL